MSRASSPLRDRLIFLVGVQRSGTNWLQRLIAAHPEVVAVPSETNLFSLGLPPLRQRFHHGSLSSPQTGVVYADPDVLRDALRDFCDTIFLDLVKRLDPTATRILERTPDHARHLDLVAEVYPDAWVVHIIRDGRDVARSLASQTWGPASFEEALRLWLEVVTLARKAGSALDRYLEVRYEDLVADTPRELHKLFELLGLETLPDIAQHAVEEAAAPFNVDPAAPEIAAEKWRRHLGPRELEIAEALAGPLLAELGYDRFPGGGGRPQGLRVPPRSRGALRPVLARLRRARRAAAAQDVLRMRAEVRSGAALVQTFLDRLHSRSPAEAASLLDPEATVHLHTPSGSWTARGGRGRDELVRALSADPAFHLPQTRGDAHASARLHVIVATYARRHDRVFVVWTFGNRILRLAYYRLD